MNDPTQVLRHRLEQAADDRHRPPHTDLADLLARARADRDRHRRTTLAAAALTVAAVLGTGLGVRAALGDGAAPSPGPSVATPSPSPSPDAAEDAPVPSAQILSRCRPQNAKYAKLPMYSDDARGWSLAHPERSYRVGDVVSLRPADGLNPILCVLPAADAVDDPVPFAALEPSPDDTDLIRQMCSEILAPQPAFDERTGTLSPGKGTTPDLRRATVDAVAHTGRVLTVLLGAGRESWQCSLAPLDWDSGITDVSGIGIGLANVGVNGSTTGASNKSIVGETASYYYGAGRLPRRAATIELLIQGADPVTVPVVDGAWAIAHKVSGGGGLGATRYRVLDAQGGVLFEQPDFR